MIDRTHALALTRQAKVLKLSRSGLYYRPRPVSPTALAIKRRIDELYLDDPLAGTRMLRDLLRGLAVDRPDQVWAMDITYIPMARGFVYLAAVVDRFSRRIRAWRVSIDMAVGFCLEAVEEALAQRAGHLQHGSRLAVHRCGLHRPAG